MERIETALVVDNDFLMRGYVVESLKNAGLFVVEAPSGAEASRLLIERKFDLVFADLEFFEPTGTRLKLMPDTVYVVMSPFRAVERAIPLVGNGVYDYLVKPFSTEQVSVILLRTRELLSLQSKIRRLENEKESPVTGVARPPVGDADLPSTYNLQELERATIIRVLHETKGRRSVMAEMLGISVRTLRNKLSQYKQDLPLQLS